MRNATPLAKKRTCYFCQEQINELDYKDTMLLRRYVSSFGRIVSRKRSGVCMHHQRKLATAIKQARVMALLPFTQK